MEEVPSFIWRKEITDFADGLDELAEGSGTDAFEVGLAMAFKLMLSAQTKWRKLDAANRFPEIIEGIAFKDGIKKLQNAA